MSRLVALIVVVAVHLGLVAVFTVARKPHRDIPEEELSTTIVFLSSMPTAEPALPPALVPEASSKPKSSHARESDVPRGAASIRNQSLLDSPAETPQLSEGEQPPAAASIDWSREAELAASRQVASLDEAHQRASRFTMKSTPQKTSPTPEFHWSLAHTKRIEPLPQGGTLLRINERCALVISGGLLPFCSLGKIEARGDLFEHMRDAPEPGDANQSQ